MKNSDFNPHIAAIRHTTGRNPDFSIRNYFDVYVVATNRNRNMLLSWSMKPDVIEVWGNARFSPAWIDKLSQFVPPFESKPGNTNNQRVLVFLPSSSSGFKIDLVHSLIERLAKENMATVLKPHTREGQDIEMLLPSWLLHRASMNVALDVESSALMRWADTVINFATGTAIEALIQGKRIIFTRYLTDNILSWEDCAGVAIADSEDAVINFLLDQSWGNDAIAIEPYLRQEVFADGKVSEPLAYYAEQLEGLANTSQR